jgi:hypothetical protein
MTPTTIRHLNHETRNLEQILAGLRAAENHVSPSLLCCGIDKSLRQAMTYHLDAMRTIATVRLEEIAAAFEADPDCWAADDSGLERAA